jgi:hypothetical protein
MNSSSEILSTVFSLAMLSASERASIDALDSELARSFVRSVYRDVKNSPLARTALADLLRRAEKSELPLDMWIKDITRVCAWLETQASKASFADIVDYVGCAIEGSDLQTGHSIEWYLEHHGFARCEKIATTPSR